MRSSKNWCGGA